MRDAQIIEALGGTNRVARLCKVKPPSVSGWKRTGIPGARLDFLKLKCPAVFAQLAAEATATTAVRAAAASDNRAVA